MISSKEIIIRLLLAALFGGLVGLERERKDWAAGLRTHMVVCVGATLTMIVSAFGFHEQVGSNGIVLDPSRVAAQVISGVGFIGAGTILFLRQRVIRGLTTAAGLWTVSAIGLATGGGMYVAAGATTVIVIIILLILKPLEGRLKPRKSQMLQLTIHSEATPLSTVNEILSREQLHVVQLLIDKDENDAVISLTLSTGVSDHTMVAIADKLKGIEGIKEISWDPQI